MRWSSFWPILLVPSVASATDVIGNINVDTRWTEAGSPYRLTGDVVVASQATLTIEPGVVIQAATSDALGAGTNTSLVELVVRGRILADGTLAKPITVQSESAVSGSWYGLSIEPTAGPSSLTQVLLSHARIGLWMRGAASVVLSDSTFASNSEKAILWQSNTAFAAQRVTFRDNRGYTVQLEDAGSGGVDASFVASVFESNEAALSATNRVRLSIAASRFALNQSGIKVEAGASLVLENSVLVGNADYGLWVEQTGTAPMRITNNTLDRNYPQPAGPVGATGTGIVIQGVSNAASFIVRNNIVTSQAVGISCASGIQPALDHNNVWGNTTNYVGLEPGAGSISANPLYVATLGGAPYQFESNPISSGPLPDRASSNSWTVRHPGAVRMRVLFTSLSTESCCDFVRLYDARGTQVASYSGTFSGPSQEVFGDTIQITVTTDGSVGSAGFTISGYEWSAGTQNYRLQASSPAIDVGNGIGAPTLDADGITRPYDGDVNGTPEVDLGAYEWHENVAPLAVAGADRIVRPGDSVEFDARGSRDPDGAIVSYAWDFGDSTGDSVAAVSHSYATVGTYTVTLTVTDSEGAVGTDTAVISVVNNLPPTAVAGPDRSAMVGESITFDGGGSTDPDGAIVSYEWDFDDGSPAGSGRSVSHSYAASGVYVVTLTVTDNGGGQATDTVGLVIGAGSNTAPIAVVGGPYSGAPGSTISFNGSGSSDSDGSIASYAWDFGDTTSGTGVRPTHSYAAVGAYVVRLTVTDDRGATDEDVTVVNITAGGNVSPSADAGGPYQGKVGAMVAFDGSGSMDSDGTLETYAWDFGDGNQGTGAQTTHGYAAAGSYTVKLTVTDDEGATSQATTVAVITEEVNPNNQNPVAEAGMDITAEVNASVLLNGADSTDADGTISSYAWDFGDGNMGTGVAVQHVYTAVGSYVVKLTVTDDDGATDQDFMQVTITKTAEPDPTPNTSSEDRESGCGCSTSPRTPGSGSFALWGLLALLLRRRR